MADELNTIRTTELQKLDTSQVVDILVNSADDAGRIALTDFLAGITTNSDWYSITSKPFTDLDIEYFTTKVSEEGFPVLSFNEDISADLHKLSEISDITNGLSTRIVALETDSHTHENKEIIDLFSITEDNKLSWNGAEVGYKLTPATTEILGGVKPDGGTITIDEDGTLHGANTYELPVAAANSLGGIKVDNTDINITEDGVIHLGVASIKTLGGVKVDNTDINITEDGIIHLGIASIDTLGGVKVDGDSIAINEDGTIFAVPKGLDFSAIAAAMTGGTLKGIEITADESLEVFNFNVTKTPEIKIDEEGYWTIEGNRGENPTKAQGEKGDTGTVEINADCVVLYATFLADSWSSEAPYTQTVTVEGITENHVPIVDISYSEDTSLWQDEGNAFALLSKVETGNGNIVGTCLSNKPEINFTIKLKIAGDITYDIVVSREEFNNTIGDINTILASVTGGIG